VTACGPGDSVHCDRRGRDAKDLSLGRPERPERLELGKLSLSRPTSRLAPSRCPLRTCTVIGKVLYHVRFNHVCFLNSLRFLNTKSRTGHLVEDFFDVEIVVDAQIPHGGEEG
jgi:hypothetical protein